MATEDYRRKLTAILSADVKGYSRLMGADDAATIRTLTAYRQVMASLITDYHGRVVDSPGDNILADFPSVVDAVQCAVEIQKALKAKNTHLPEDRRMEFRIGINLGDVIEDEGRLYGDGVNIAARLEGLAEPGGICVSGTVHENIRNRVSQESEYLGEQAVKNVEEPVPVYRILLEPADRPNHPAAKRIRLSRWLWLLAAAMVIVLIVSGAFWIWNSASGQSPSPAEVASEQTPTIDLPDKPSIAVLPFVNMSADPEQEYFSDGITEDLITDLSKISALFVIARNSTFVYKGTAVNIREVGEDLGVAYVLEGSVRKADARIRITAQLIDATTGGHLWAERYDRNLEDVFAVQDEVVEKIVGALAVTLTEAEQEYLAIESTHNLETYDLVKRGWWYYRQLTQEANDRARQLFEEAIERDPRYVDAYAGLGFTYYEQWAQQWSQDPQTLDQAYNSAIKAINLNDAHAAAHTLLSHVHLRRGEFERAILEQERAIVLDPNNADNYRDLAEVLIFAGRPEDAIEHVERAMSLNPHYPVTYPFTTGFAYALLGLNHGSVDHYEDAIIAAKEAVALNPNFTGSHLLLAFIYNETEREQEARSHVAQALTINPQLSLAAIRDSVPIRDPAVLEAFLDVLRDSGLD